jgi:hypothetical protein
MMPAKPEVIARAIELAKQFASSPNLMTGIEKQRGCVAQLHLMQMPCWLCAEPVSYYEAVGEDYSPENYRGADEPFHCPHCKTQMMHMVPFITVPHPWFWGNPKIYKEKKHAQE